MDLNQLVSDLIVDSKGRPGLFAATTADSSIGVFLPELILCGTVLLLLLVRVFRVGEQADRALVRLTGAGSAFYLALLGAFAALVATAPWAHLGSAPTASELLAPATVTRMEIFTGMLVYDTFAVFVRSVLLLFLVLFVLFTRLTGVPDPEDGADIYSLVFGATLGMCLMAAANHLLMIFMAVEMASVPSYVLAGLSKGRRRASEAALKYSIYGAGAAGLMLYGISLLAGVLNTAHLPTMAQRLSEILPGLISDGPSEQLMVLSVAGLMLMAGLAFKLSAVPFHFWCPDVFEGATAEVNAFLSVASKAAALALLVRVAIGLGTVPPEGFRPGERTALVEAQHSTDSTESNEVAGLFAVDNEHPATANEPSPSAAGETAEAAATPSTTASAASTREETLAALAPARNFIGKLIALLAIVTCTFGNLAAYGQTNIKRLLAYSTIAHAGYMMMAVPPIVAMVGTNPEGAEKAAAALSIYVGIYLFMNLGAFAVVAFLRNSMRSEEIADYGGLLKHSPVIVICFSLILFSLVGLPPLAGFIGKFAVFGALAEGYQSTSQGYLLVLLVAGGINTAISLYYYLRVVKVMTMSPDPESRVPFQVPFLALTYVVLVTVPTVWLMFGWNRLNELALAAARHLIS